MVASVTEKWTKRQHEVSNVNNLSKAPELRTVSEDPIKNTDLVRHTAAHFCPNCGSNLNLVDRDDWHRNCPNCEYVWVPAYEA